MPPVREYKGPCCTCCICALTDVLMAVEVESGAEAGFL